MTNCFDVGCHRSINTNIDQRLTIYYLLKYQGTSVKQMCEQCNKANKVPHSNFCSIACGMKANKINEIKHPYSISMCINCNIRPKNIGHEYCSKECAKKMWISEPNENENVSISNTEKKCKRCFKETDGIHKFCCKECAILAKTKN